MHVYFFQVKLLMSYSRVGVPKYRPLAPLADGNALSSPKNLTRVLHLQGRKLHDGELIPTFQANLL